MNLDEMERLALSIKPLHGTDANNLARFVLAVLPVVREVELWLDYLDLIEKQAAAHNTGVVGADLCGEPLSYIQPSARSSLQRESRGLRKAIDSLRRARDGKSP